MMKGKFIVIEGCEGAGKSYQTHKLVDRLVADGLDVVATREPGGTTLAEELRRLILSPDYSPSALSELFMYSASRRDHLEKTVMPAVESGKIVICDRFIYSTLAYQGYARGLDLELVRKVNEYAIAPNKVDLALFLDITPEEGFARKGGADSSDRLERENLEFFNKVYHGFDEMCRLGELKRIDARGEREQTAEKLYSAVMEIL